VHTQHIYLPSFLFRVEGCTLGDWLDTCLETTLAKWYHIAHHITHHKHRAQHRGGVYVWCGVVCVCAYVCAHARVCVLCMHVCDLTFFFV
jgi:hypothetical protein